MSLPEVAYFRYMREYHKRFGHEEDFLGPKKIGQELRPNPFDINYGFFVPDLVCWEHSRPSVKFDIDYNKWTADDGEVLQAFRCKECGRLDPVSFKRCISCGSCFYDLFRHPNQADGYHHCWNCLEGGSSRGAHGYYSRYTKHAPPDELIPPVVTQADLKAADDDFMENVRRLLAN